MNFPTFSPGDIPPDPVAPDSLKGIPRQQTKISRWQGQRWDEFVTALNGKNIYVREEHASCSIYITDAGGMAIAMPHGIVKAESAEQISEILKAAQLYKVPVKVRGGALTTEGESVAFGGLLLDMAGMRHVIEVDKENLTARTQAGIYWHSLAEVLRRQGLDYISAPLNLTASVGGTLSVGGIDVNSPKHGCSADQTTALQVVTPTGKIVECSEIKNRELFERVLLGYGQFGVITEATLRIRKFNPISMHYFYYKDIRTAIEDMMKFAEDDVADYIGILTMLDRAINLLVAFDSREREQAFFKKHRNRVRGYGEIGFAIRMGIYYTLRPWKFKQALYLLNRKQTLMPEFNPEHHMQGNKIVDRTVVYSRSVWKFWGGKQMVIPDLATNAEKFIEAVERGNEVCKKYFPHYTLYCVGIKLRKNVSRYEMSCIPPDAENIAYGCEFEPMLENKLYSNDHLQSFKNEIYDIGVDMNTSYYRFGGMMKGYIRRALGDKIVEKHLKAKQAADPEMILNADVIF